MKKLGTLSTLLLLIFIRVNAQGVCGSMEYYHQQIQENPSMAEAREAIERHTQNYVQAHPNGERIVVTIPVVVHVIYNISAQNISSTQIQSQIDILNHDYRKLNADTNLVPLAFAGLAADCEINFCLAQQDLVGNATTGIERRYTTLTSFGAGDPALHYYTQGGLDAWDRTKYLNIWVCNISGGILGYSQAPGGPAATDGVVINYSAFGNTGAVTAPFNKGRITTHEVGHWLNLIHIWGDDGTACTGTDNVSDTPNQAGNNYGTPIFPKTDACSPTYPGVMFMNYMDYVDDAAMCMFTTGQKVRMQALFAANGFRVSLLTSPGCNAAITCNPPTSITVVSISNTGATVSWGAVPNASNYILEYNTAGATTWTALAATTNTTQILTGLTAGTVYDVRVKNACGTMISTYSSPITFTTTTSINCAAPSNVVADVITPSVATITWTTVSGASNYIVEYKKSTASTWTVITGVIAASKTLTGLTAPTTYYARVKTICGTTPSAYSPIIIFTTVATCTSTYEPNNTLGTATSIPSGTAILSQIQTLTDEDFYSFNNTNTNKNIQVSLTNLPLNYNMTLYYPNGTTAATSQNSGTTSEIITLNFPGVPTVGSYKIKVNGYNSAYSSTACYNLLAEISSSDFISMIRQMDDNSKPTFEKPTISPNPTDGMAILRFNLTEETDVVVNIYDQVGRLVSTMNQHLAKDNGEIEINLFNVTSGFYFIKVANNGILTTHKLLVSK